MGELQNDLFLRALMRKPVPRTPVWIMRQAGRYLPEYRETSGAKAGDFMSLCGNPGACLRGNAAAAPALCKLDAAILFSDILTVPGCHGLRPVFRNRRGSEASKSRCSPPPMRFARWRVPDMAEQELGYVFDAVSLDSPGARRPGTVDRLSPAARGPALAPTW